MNSVPKRWHVYTVDLEPRIGTKPGKQRPCVVIQPQEFCEAGLNSSVILPFTTRIIKENAFPLRVRIPKGICKLAQVSDVLIDQILAWDNSLFAEDLGILPDALIDEIKKALRNFLDLDV